MDAPAMRRDEVTGHPRPFRADELASMKTVADSNPALLLSDSAIQGDRPIACECGHAILGRHNNDVSAARRRLNAPVEYL